MATHTFLPGEKVWLPDPEDAYLMGRVKSATSSQVEIVSEKGGQIVRLHPREASKFDLCGSHVDSTQPQENLVDLDEFSEGAILHHVRLRFQRKLIYTHVGAILVAVNPFEQLPIYGMDEMNRAYKGVTDSSVYPHIYITAATAFMQLRTHKRHQSVLISGESGAGKTETTKKVLEYLALMSSGEGSSSSGGVEKKILQSNPLLEALGNAKTRRNDNSSRFGKWMKVDFDAACRIQGCEIVNYLLEKSRVVGASTDERNYHVFYQLLKGADDELKSKLGLTPGRSDTPASFKYLVSSNGGGYTVDSIDDVSDFHDMQTAMATLQLAPETQLDLFRILAAILLLGNLSFGPGDGQLGAGTAPLVEQIASLLQVTQANLLQALTEKHMYIKGVLQPAQPYTVAQATDNRDALAKALYSNLFDSTIRHINSTLKLDASSNPIECLHIGVLDIFGFEVFAKNSFEQLCINYCNEKLQSHFNEVIFTAEMQMYKDEGISTESISFKDIDNSECVSLIEGKPIGLLCMLDAECVIGSASDVSYVANVDKAFGEVDVFKSSKLAGIKMCWSFLAKYGGKAGAGASCGNPQCALLHAKDITDVFPKSTSSDKETWKEMCKYATDVFAKNHQNSYYTKAKTSKVCFSVKHFAGAVEYTVGREPKSGEPSSSFSKEWLDKNSDELSALVVDCMLSSKSALICAGFGGGGRKAGEQQQQQQQQGNKVSLGGQFRNQLIQLVENLNRTEPHFVRCVKSNNAKRGGVFDGHLVLEQLKYAGLFEAIRIRKAGYAYRASHDVFANQYLILVPGLLKEKFRNPTYFNVKDACIRIIKQVVEKDRVLFQGTAVVGHTKVFIKENSHRTDLDHFWRQKRNHFSAILSRFAKRYVDYHRTRSEREKLEAELRRTREKLEREKQEALERELHRSRQAVLLQKHARRFLVRCLFINMQDLIELRKALDPQGSKVYAEKYPKRVERLKELIARIEKNSAAGGASSKSSALIRAMFSQEVAVARTMMKLIEIQETFRNDVKRAVDECDVVVLNKLLVRAERLEMANDEVVVEARAELRNLHRRRTVMKNMVAFLKNEYESSVDPAELLREARTLGVDEMFISKVKRVYDGAGPRLHTRTRLRTAIETIDRRAIESGVQEIEAIQQFRGREAFGEGEARAGRLMLRMLAFEAQVGGGGGGGAAGYQHLFLSGEGGGVGDDDDDVNGDEDDGVGRRGPGALLTSEMISLCDEICSTSSLEAAKAAKRRLQHLASGTSGGSKGKKASSFAVDTGLENVVRWYKWSKMLCTWKYPEVGGGGGGGGGEGEEYEFFGLRASEARSSVFLIRTLHSDVGGSDAPPSVQAALGALDLPANVKETLDKLERSFVKEEEEKRRVAAEAAKEKEKLGKMTHATQRRLKASPTTKPVVQVKNIKPKPLHPFVDLSSDLEAKLLESRKNLFRQVDHREDSLTRLDRYKKKAAFRN